MSDHEQEDGAPPVNVGGAPPVNVGGAPPVNGAAAPPNATYQIARVGVKVPPFWKPDPVLWFAQLESQFFRANITQDETKYHIVVSEIESAILAQVSDILTDITIVNKYEEIKKRLIQQFADSEEHRLRKLLKETPIGDNKPSQLLREMRDLAGKRLSDEVLKSLWLQRLPEQAQMILSTMNENLSKTAEIADKIIEVAKPVEICALGSGASGEIAALTTMVAELTKKIERLEVNNRSRTPTRGHFRDHARNRSHSRSQSQTGECWYHNVFKERAHKCLPPCSFRASSKEGKN